MIVLASSQYHVLENLHREYVTIFIRHQILRIGDRNSSNEILATLFFEFSVILQVAKSSKYIGSSQGTAHLNNHSFCSTVSWSPGFRRMLRIVSFLDCVQHLPRLFIFFSFVDTVTHANDEE